jgi:hypothetical protein
VVGQFEVALTGTAFSRDVARAESNRLQPPRDSVFKLTHDRNIRHMNKDLGKRANFLHRPVAVLGLWHLVRRIHDFVLHIATKNGYRRRQRIRRWDRIGQARRDLGVGQRTPRRKQIPFQQEARCDQWIGTLRILLDHKL